GCGRCMSSDPCAARRTRPTSFKSSMCSASACVLFVSAYALGHPCDLHSFPTRRSSDLGICRARTRRTGYPDLVRYFAARDQEIQDRKSTRLNSSHGSISYAVFCLKKKKTNPNPNQSSPLNPLPPPQPNRLREPQWSS